MFGKQSNFPGITQHLHLSGSLLWLGSFLGFLAENGFIITNHTTLTIERQSHPACWKETPEKVKKMFILLLNTKSKVLKVCVVKNKFCWEKYWTLKVLSKCLANIIKINGENSGHSSHSLTSRNIQNSTENVYVRALKFCAWLFVNCLSVSSIVLVLWEWSMWHVVNDI